MTEQSSDWLDEVFRDLASASNTHGHYLEDSYHIRAEKYLKARLSNTLTKEQMLELLPEKLGSHRDPEKRAYAGGFDDAIDKMKANIREQKG